MIVNYFLLSAVKLILHFEIKRIRLFIGAAAGSLYSLVIFLPELPETVSILMNLTASAGIVAITFCPKTFKIFLKQTAAFFTVNFVFAGLMLAVWLVLRPNGMAVNNSIVYFDIDIKTLTVSTVICYAVINLLSKFVRRSSPEDKIFSVTFTDSGRSITVNALLDTGNTLKDGFSSSPVIIADEDVIKALVGFSAEDCFFGNNALDMSAVSNGIRLIACNTVAGKSLLKAVCIEQATVNATGYTVKNVILAQSKTKFTNGEYKAILNNGFFEGMDFDDEKVHRISFGKDKTTAFRH